MGITNYIKNKSGFGIYFLLFISATASVIFSLYLRYTMQQTIPYTQEVADQILPIKIEQNKILYPANTIQNINLFSDYPEINFQIGVDTTSDTINTEYLQPGIYLTKSALYTIINGQTKISKLQDTLYLPKGDYSHEFNRIINYICLFIFLISFILLLIILSVSSLFFASISYLFTSTLKIYPSFSLRFRSANLIFSTICTATLLCKMFDINIQDWIFFGTIILLHIYIMSKASKE